MSVKDATGYAIYMANGKKKNSKIIATVDAGTLKYLVKGLKKNRVYNFKVVALYKDQPFSESPIIYSVAGKAFKGKVEAKRIKAKRKLKVKVRKAKKIKATVISKGGKKLLRHAKKLRYFVEDPTIAKVSRNGKVKGLKKGTTKVWLLTVNGVRRAVRVTVK